jgi:catechol 2,3-dioxygenase-like lactoylglutathione lyase family enzyme
MIGYVTLGTNDMARACAYYDALLAEIGAKRIMDEERFVFWGTDMQSPSVGVITPFDGQEARRGNGAMVALVVGTPAQVDALHAKALALGGTDEGAPGERFKGFYVAYFRDPDGNKLNFFCLGA